MVTSSAGRTRRSAASAVRIASPARKPKLATDVIGDTVSVKVLDIDRQRQRISLGLKQTQEDPWQRVVDTYNIGDELEGTVTKVDAKRGWIDVKTDEGSMKLQFPPAALADVKAGDRVSVELGMTCAAMGTTTKTK